jgi:predicted ATPase
MISSVTIQGFKSYKSLKDFSLRPLNVLIGPNRSGKTNFLDFWDLLSQAGKQQLPNAISKRGGIGSVISWNRDASLKFELDFEAHGPFAPENGIRYSVDLVKQQLTYSIANERLAQNPKKTGLQNSRLIISSGTGIIYKHAAGKNERQEIRLDSTTDLAITQIRDAASYTTLDKLRRYLANITVHRPFNTDDNSPIRNAQPIGVREAEVPPTRLSRGGENLTNVLYFMHNEPKYQDYYEEYLATLRRGFPSFEQLIFPADVGQGKTIMAWKDRYMPKRAITANLLSDGTLCFMCLLAALYDPEPPSILCIDEPEVSLHPQLIRLLASVLEEASDRMQIIVATHSPDLISALQNADDVVVAEAEDGWSTLKRLSQKDLQHWLQEYSLGELWESGEIGGRL